MNNKELKNYFNDIIKDYNFKQKGNKWKIETEELIKEVELQKSNFSNSYYLNFGFIIKDLELQDLRQHIFSGISSNLRCKKKLVSEVLDLETTIIDDLRKSEIKYIINELLLPKIVNVNNKIDLLNFINNLSTKNIVPLVVKRYYNIS